MTWGSVFIFRIIIGAVFVGQYLFGGRYGEGNPFFLILGLVFIGYGAVGFVQLQKKKGELEKNNDKTIN